jgi:predicted nucleic acid-binding protein
MLDEAVLIDTSAFAALFNPRDGFHDICKRQFQDLPVSKCYTCWPVVTETFNLIRDYPNQQDEFLNGIASDDFSLLWLTKDDVPGIQQVVSKYRDQEVDLADAALVHLATREGIGTVFTLDRRHFNVFRHSGRKTFRLLPDLDQ